MDEVFWSNVLKRWSDASESVILLKKELVRAHEERDRYHRLLNDLRKIDVCGPFEAETLLQNNERVHTLLDHERDHSTVTDELQDAEMGLNKAKEEYRRLQQELASSNAEIVALKLEKEKLCIDHRQQISKLQFELANARIASRDREVGRLQRREASEKSAAGFKEIHQPTVISVSEREKALEKEASTFVEYLKGSFEATRRENQNLLEELVTTREKLQKAENVSKALLTSIVKLKTITRHSSALTPHSWSVSSLQPDSCGSSGKLSFGSVGHSKNSIMSDNRETLRSSTPQVDRKTTARNNAQWSYPFLSPARERILAKLPPVPATLVDSEETAFNRDLLKNALNDNMASLINYLPKSRVDQTIVSSYLCPTLNHHPWCPSVPGQHGFIFIGLGKEQDSYRSPVIRNLFVGLSKCSTKKRMFRYLGKYKVSRIEPLAVEEWLSFPNELKQAYARVTKVRANDARTVETILQDYDKGDLLVPCVLLQFMTFDDSFFAALLAYKEAAARIAENK